MTAVLCTAGFRQLETLHDFAKRYPNVPCILDSELEKIWICHRSRHKIPKLEDVDLDGGIDYHRLSSALKKKINSSESFLSHLTEFKAVFIFDKIFKHFRSFLTTYLFKNCYLFYNWGINAFEPLWNHFKIHQIINLSMKLSTPKRRKNELRLLEKFINISEKKINSQKCYQPVKQKNTLQNNNSSVTVIRHCSKSSLRKISYKSVKKAVQKSKPFCNIVKNKNDPSQEVFNLNRILYDIKQRPQWPKNHILSQNDVDKLIIFIVQLPIECTNGIQMKLLNDSRNWLKLTSILKIFIERHQIIEKNNGYGRILKKYLKNVKTASDKTLTPIPKSVVCSYIIDILRRVWPLDLFGSNHNRKKFFSELVKIITGSKKQNFIWFPLLSSLFKNKSELNWCTEISGSYAQNYVILKLFKWIIIHYVFVILKCNFYITETGSSSFGLRFYRKCDIESASIKFCNHLLQHGHIHLLKKFDHDIFSVERKWIDTGIIDGRDLERKPKEEMNSDTGFKQPIAVVRFLPKNDRSDEMRLITNIAKKKTKILNSNQDCERLCEVFEKQLAKRHKQLFFVKLFLEFIIDKIGFGINPVPHNPKIAAAWNKAIYLKKTYGHLYFVKADIADAFDSVLHTTLIKIIQENISSDNSVQLKKILEWKMEKGAMRKTMRLSYTNGPQENSILIRRSLFEPLENITSNHCYEKYVSAIKQIVTLQRLEIKGKVYKLVKGLAQGSAGKFSPQLCEIYYSSMDRTYFKEFINCENSVLLRGVDDYLFITADFDKANRFLTIINDGIRWYNAKFNKHKLKSNLIEDIKEFAYLGLIFNVEDMSVRPSYSRHKKRNLLSSMKLSDWWGNVHFNKDYFLESRALCLGSLKLQPILLYNSHNNLKLVRQIVFQACLIQSLRVLTLVRYLYQDPSKHNIPVCEILFKAVKKVENIVKNNGMTVYEIRWLFLFAVCSIFKKFSGQFECLLVVMRFFMKRCESMFVKNETEMILQLKNDVRDYDVKDIFKPLIANTKPFNRLLEKQ